MSDFLHSLRTGKFKRHDRNHRGYNESHNKPSQRRNDGDNRKSNQQATAVSGQVTAMLSESISGIKTVLEALDSNQKRLADAYESKVKAQERTAKAIEIIAEILKQRFGSELEETTAEQPDPEHGSNPNNMETKSDSAQKAVNTDREELFEDIKNMRKEGMSFENIAQLLESRKIPTVSGKGQWRGQTVSKLCKQMNLI